MLKSFEVLLLVMAIAAVGIYLFYEAGYLIYIALAGGIGYSVIHFIRTYSRKRGTVLGKPDAKYYNTFDSHDDDFSNGDHSDN
ncbi:hypothetical protein [Halobacillus sp. A5]|uniref:hypothetical protein n=1 Tax=Halobacillus sp. A5 TaxID=2880263 RepID=UPI0020A62233|nr:hypothetical protein [Halobacillus sp. A5]MCP3027690.1 hypothetical protein [Halobacillus sp. A5]